MYRISRGGGLVVVSGTRIASSWTCSHTMPPRRKPKSGAAAAAVVVAAKKADKQAAQAKAAPRRSAPKTYRVLCEPVVLPNPSR